jgi:RNA polymerase sigma factor (sigma-70 family)
VSDPAAAAIEALFRGESGRITAWLLRLCGPRRLALVEDAVQDALVAALRSWRIGGIPADPSAWLAAAARNAAVDRLRRARRWGEDADAAGAIEPQVAADETLLNQATPLGDDLLMLLFVCAHPALAPAARVTLMARAVCGFTAEEIAAALHEKQASVAQRLTRARARLSAGDVAFEWPDDRALAQRLDDVLAAIHLMFTAGHRPLAGDDLVDAALCREALRLAELVAADRRTGTPGAHALAALMALHHARHPARLDAAGMPVPLAEQDRSRWDGALVTRGFGHLRRAIGGDRLTRWHLEAEIAAAHAAAPDIAATDWAQIVRAYDDLVALTASPSVRLARAIAVSWRDGPLAGFVALDALARAPGGLDAALLHAARAEMAGRAGDPTLARASWLRAAEAARAPLEKRAFAARAAGALAR